MKVLLTVLMVIAINIPTYSLLADISPFRATYSLSKYDIKLATVVISLSRDKGLYTYEKITNPGGLLRLIAKNASVYEQSTFTITDDTIRSVEYTSEIKRREKRTYEHYVFSNDTTINVEHNDERYELDVERGTLDRASMEIALMLQAEAKNSLGFKVIHKGKVRDYSFEYLGTKTIENKTESYECLDYKVSRSSGKRSTAMCLAQSLGYLPVFIEHNEKGTLIQMELTDLKTIEQ